MEDVLIETIDDHVAVLTLNRPQTLNALNTTLMRRLAEAVQRAADNDQIRCVVLTGAGRGFCSGGDVKASNAASTARETGEPAKQSTLETRVRWLRRSQEAARLLFEMGKPTIAMINGPCAGAGLSLAGACDLRFAAASATFASAFTRMGMPGDYGGSWLWTRLLGAAKARELYLLSETMNAADAHAFGLVNRVYADDRLKPETMEIAHRLAGLPATGLAYAKANLNAALTDSLASSLDREALNMMLSREALIAARRAKSGGAVE